MAAAVAVVVWLGHTAPKKICRIKSPMTRTHLNEIAKYQMAFFLSPKCFG
jgi:hypothetical protein